MYCAICGIDTGNTCVQCGRALRLSNEGSAEQQSSEHPWLWNPDVAAVLSWLLFTSLFGSLIHAANWKRLGQRGKMWKSVGWAATYVATIMAVVIYGTANHDSDSTYKLVLLANFLNVAFWYFISGRAQSKYLVIDMKNQYRRESWIIPIALAMLFAIAINTLS
ncbi:hypothetical protein WNB94_17180 [Aquabacterium sp. A3]|uniref:hypothetical protein n=1 Tax=Aquabacterium sp. A3 TaxID=3132829 RepID=UPI00311A01DF